MVGGGLVLRHSSWRGVDLVLGHVKPDFGEPRLSYTRRVDFF